MSDFCMPSLGTDMQYGTLVEWYVEPGSQVRRGQVIALVDTHKGAIEVEVFEDGVVREILTRPGERVPVGAAMARITVPGESPSRPSPPAAAAATIAAPAEASAAPPAAPPSVAPAAPPTTPRAPAPTVSPPPTSTRTPLRGTGPGGAVTLEDVRAAAGARPPAGPAAPPARPPRARASPIARRMAEALGIDLAAVQGTGARGTVVRADVERAAAGAAKPAPPMRQAIAAAVTRSKREIPHYYLATEADMTAALAWLARVNQGRPSKELLLPAALQLRAVALALREFPDFNGFWIDGALRPVEGIHVGVAVSLRGGGLIVPAIHDADRLDADALMRALADVVARARTGRLRGSEVTAATITVTNLGDRGVDTVFGVIYPPQVALVGFGRIAERPWAEGGLVGTRYTVTVTLSADHRASDGHRGSLFLAAIARRLAEPERP